MLNKPLIIGLVGEKGAGKGTFAKFLQKIISGSAYIRFSDILFETLESWSLPLTRTNYQNLANTMERAFGSGTTANAIKNRIKNLSGNVIIVDGIRRWPEENLIRSFPKNIIIYITADPKTRYRNLKNKSSKEKETGLSFKQFMQEEDDDAEILIPEIGKTADYKIVNNNTLVDLQKKAKEFYDMLLVRLQLGH